MNQKYTFVTVAYIDDIGFMHLQARSMAKYVSRDLLDEILIIENGPPRLPDGWRYKLKRSFGPLADLVKFVPPSTIAKIPDNVAGWFSQQLLKLKIAKIVRSPYYVVLDAKNHFTFTLTREHMETAGKPRMFVHGYLNHPLTGRYLEPILAYFNLPAEHIKRMLPTTPPFYMPTALVCEMMESMAKRQNRSFEDVFFRSKIRFTEFFTLSAYILSTDRRFEDFYDLTGTGYSIIWKYAGHDDAAIQREISRTEQRELPLFSVHRGAFPLLSEHSREAIAGLWDRRGLFPSLADGLRFLTDPSR